MKHRDSIYLLQNFKGNRDRFKLVDNLIFDTRVLNEKSIEDFTPDENRGEVLGVVLKASSIYGFKPMPTDLFLNDLCDTIIDYLFKFEYGELLWSEVKLALVINSHPNLKYPSGEEYESVQIKGHYFNVQYLGQILANYMVFRNNLDEMIKKMFDGIMPYTTKF